MSGSDRMRKALDSLNKALERRRGLSERVEESTKPPKSSGGLMDELERRRFWDEQLENVERINKGIGQSIPQQPERGEVPEEFRWYQKHGRAVDKDAKYDTGKHTTVPYAQSQIEIRERWLRENGYPPGTYPEPENDPFNRLERFFALGARHATTHTTHYSVRTKSVVQRGENWKEWRAFWQLWRAYGLNDKDFDWVGFREWYKAS